MSDIYTAYREVNPYFSIIIIFSLLMTIFIIPIIFVISYLFEIKTVKNVPLRKKFLFYSSHFIYSFITLPITVFVINQLGENYEEYTPFLTPLVFFLNIIILMPLGYLCFVKEDIVDYFLITISFTLSTFFAFTLVLLSSENGFLGFNFPDFISLDIYNQYFIFTYFLCYLIHSIMYIRVHHKYMNRNSLKK